MQEAATSSSVVPNQSLQQTKPPVTVRACARPAPAVFAAEAGCYAVGRAMSSERAHVYKLAALVILLCASDLVHAQGITLEVEIDDVVHPAGCGVGGYLQLSTDSEPTAVSGALTVLGGKLSYTIVGPDGRRTVVSSNTGRGSWCRSVGQRNIDSNAIVRIPLFLFSWNGVLLFAEPGTYKLIVAADILPNGTALTDSVTCEVTTRGVGCEEWTTVALQYGESLAIPFGMANMSYDQFLAKLQLPADSVYWQHARYFFAYQFGETAVPRLMANATSTSSEFLNTLTRGEYNAAIFGGQAITDDSWSVSGLWTYLQVLLRETFDTQEMNGSSSRPTVEWWLH